MQTFIINTEYIPNLFSGEQRINAGETAVQVDRDTYKIFDRQGKDKNQVVSAEIIKGLGKSPVNLATGKSLAQEIGAQLKSARTARKMTLEEVGAKIRASRSYMSGLESGKESCSMERLKRICDALNYELKIKITRKYK